MKIRMTLLTAMMVLVSGIIFAAETQEKTGLGQKQTMPERRVTTPRTMQNREAMVKEMMAKRADVHAKAIEELAAIKKLAEEENATKTAAAIQAMIDKKNEEYKKDAEQAERQRRERAEQVQKRLSEQQSKTEESTETK